MKMKLLFQVQPSFVYSKFKKCFFTRNTNSAINAEGFVDIDLETLCAVLERDTLRVKELDLFQSVLK